MSTAESRERSQDIPWYHVCERCNAKWFAIARRATCPRCERRSRSTERLVPPWLCQFVTINALVDVTAHDG